MNIKQIRLVNFKNIKDSTITFKDNMSGIYGPNGTGKTAIIEAVELLQKYYSSNGNVQKDLHSEFCKFVQIGQSEMSIEIILTNKITDYKIFVKVKCDDNISVVEERISLKPSKSRKVFMDIAVLENYENDIVPTITIGKNNKLGSFFTKENFKNAIKIYINGYSYLKQVFLSLFKNEDLLNNNKDIQLFFENFYQILTTIDSIITLTLKEQSFYNNGVVTIPINCFIKSSIHPIKYSINENIYNSIESEILIDTIKNISNLLSVVIPNSKLDFKEEVVGSDELGERKNITLFLIKNKVSVSLERESTGTIKLISLLSILIIYIKHKKSIVLIDELDVHIFEYLLAVLLETIAPIAKGQLIFTGHNLLPMERLGKDSIIIATKSNDDIAYNFMKGVSASTNIRQKYLKSQAYWSEDNIEPLMLNVPALKLFVKKLLIEKSENEKSVIENGN